MTSLCLLTDLRRCEPFKDRQMSTSLCYASLKILALSHTHQLEILLNMTFLA
jgi:hypothetical protein